VAGAERLRAAMPSSLTLLVLNCCTRLTLSFTIKSTRRRVSDSLSSLAMVAR
jgi:hypothetical protein